ncbi:YgaP family membrane protein [Mucilaginibacter phyllosphaerae]
MGNLDRGLRVLAAVAIVVLYYTGVLSGTLAIILLVLAGVFILTSFISFCPLYYPFKISTKTAEDRN